MPNWIAVSPEPGSIPSKPTIGDLRSKKAKAQFEAASQAAELLAQAIDEDCHVNLSGYASTKYDTETDQIQIKVAKA